MSSDEPYVCSSWPILLAPWGGDRFRRIYDRVREHTLVSPDRCYVLHTLLRQALYLNGEVWECGTYKGGTAALMADTIKSFDPGRLLRVFDTFAGLPESSLDVDLHEVGEFSDVSIDAVKALVNYPGLTLHQGTIPQSLLFGFKGKIALLHIDLDTYRSTLMCLEQTWPKVQAGGFVVNDDYGFPSCPGARKAVDEFFAGSGYVPLCLPTGQAVIFKGL